MARSEEAMARLHVERAEKQSRLRELAAGEHPELRLQSKVDDRQKRLQHTGLIVERKFQDYTQVQMLGATRNKVFLMKRKGKNCVLKEVVVTDEASRKIFENEVRIRPKTNPNRINPGPSCR